MAVLLLVPFLVCDVCDVTDSKECVMKFTKHEADQVVNHISPSPDGTRIASASDDTNVLVWEVATGDVVFTLAHTDWVYGVAYSPDAKYIVSCTLATTDHLTLWDATTGAKMNNFVGHTNSVNSCVFTSDSLRVVSASLDSTVRVWTVATYAEERRIEEHGTSGVMSVAAAAGAPNIIASGGDDFVTKVYDISATPTVVLYTLTHQASVRSVSLNDAGDILLSCSDSAYYSDVTLGTQFKTANHYSSIYAGDIIPGVQTRSLTAGYHKSVILWEDYVSKAFTLLGHTEIVWGVAFVNATLVASCARDAVRLWDVTPRTVAPPTAVPTSAPDTTAPDTTAPDTDAPMTSAPLTKAPATDAPQTSAPDTDVPATMQPTTETPKETDVPTTAPTPQPTLAESQVPTAVPWLGAAADKEVVSPAREEAVATAATATSASMAGGAVASSVVAGGAAALPSSGLSRVSRAMVYLQMLDCPRQGMKEVPLIMSPSQLRLGRDVMREERGAAVGNMFVVLSLGLLLAAGAAVHERVTRNGSFITSLNMMPMPVFFLVLEMLWTPTMQSTTALLLHGDTAVDMAIASVVTGSCVGVLLWIWWLTWRAKQRLATVSVKPKRFLDKFIGARQKWVVRATGRHLEVGAQDTGMLVCARCVFDGYCCAHCEYLAVQLIFTGAVGALSGWNPGDIVTCSGRAGLLTCMPLIWAAVLLKDKPFTRSVENWAEVLLSLLEFVFAVVGFLGVTQERRDLLDAGMSLSEWIGHAALMKFLLQLLMYFRDRYNDKQDYGAYAPTEATKSAADVSSQKLCITGLEDQLLDVPAPNVLEHSMLAEMHRSLRIRRRDLDDERSRLSAKQNELSLAKLELRQFVREQGTAVEI